MSLNSAENKRQTYSQTLVVVNRNKGLHSFLNKAKETSQPEAEKVLKCGYLPINLF